MIKQKTSFSPLFYVFSYLIITLFFFTITACQESKTISWSEEKLINVLVDIHLAEAAIQNSFGSVKDSIGALYYKQIYERYDIKEIEFQEHLAYLKKNPAFTEEIYIKILEEINKREAGIKVTTKDVEEKKGK